MAGGALEYLLFAEDFDEPRTRSAHLAVEVVEETVEPVYRQDELDAACELARVAGGEAARLAILAARNDEHQMQVRMALADIGQAMADARHAAERLAEVQAAALATALIAMVRAMLPAACARLGAQEARAMLDALCPALQSEPRVTVHVCTPMADDLRQDVAALGLALPGEVALVTDPHLQPGDLRVVWKDGAAVRDMNMLLAGIDEALGVAGLLSEQKDSGHASGI